MTKLSIIVFAASLAAGCGDNIKLTDAGGGGSDSTTGFPAAPALGPQMDRLGRPAINTVLNHGFDTGGGPSKDAYNQDASPGGWLAAYTALFAGNLALIDVLDTGLTCNGMGTCTQSAAVAPGAGCGNQAFYNGNATGGGAAKLDSYSVLASVLTNDQLFLDTGVTLAELPATHQGYLAVELSAFGVIQNVVGGGRAPTMDVIDTSYTALAVGITGFDSSNQFNPAFGDGVGPHMGVTNTTFPFLAAPNN
ncbi:MAG: hypothetical protein ABI591_08260 [Kofleriaceae bacterium]